jgi:hypothetical protein
MATNVSRVCSAMARRFVVALLLLWAVAATAQTDEIQVYDGSLAPPGVFNLTLHDNYIARGSKTAAFPGAVEPYHSFNGVAEWAWGVTDWFEAGLYLPLYSISDNEGVTDNGFKGRALFAVPDAADRTFFYGVNFELSYNNRHWDQKRITSEIRPIVGWHLGAFDLIFNPILDNSFEGASHLDFAPATRLAYNVASKWQVAVEEYDDFGPLEDFYPSRDRVHQVFGVFDYEGRAISLEGGIGVGRTPATDDLTFKLIFSKDLSLGHRGSTGRAALDQYRTRGAQTLVGFLPPGS